MPALALNFAPSPYAAYEIMQWLLGSLADKSWTQVLLVLPFALAGCLLLAFTGRALDALSLGEIQAEGLGVNLTKLAGLVVAGNADGEAPAKELKKFDGTWKAVSITHDGKEVPKEDAEKVTLTVKGENYTLKTASDTIEGTHKLDPSKSPKAIDAVRNTGPDKGKTIRGIYELTDDTFKVCFAPAGKDRPTEFSSKKGSNCTLVRLKRVKK